MAVNLDKPHLWKADVQQSVDMYNDWFLTFAPVAFRQRRLETTMAVEDMLKRTRALRDVTPNLLRQNPSVLFPLRMCCAPPIARDRLVGLAGVSKSLVETMEKEHAIPPRMSGEALTAHLERIGNMIERLADADIFTWLETGGEPSEAELLRASTIVADRLCGAQADPIIRNAQEARQLACVKAWLEARSYRDVTGQGRTFSTMAPGTFAFRMVVKGKKEDNKSVNLPIDAVIMPKNAAAGELPLLVEAKSAGDFTNTNKRRKEEATKVIQLRREHGPSVGFILLLCGYFDSGYLGYEAAEGIDWIWEHRLDDLTQFGL